jgi:hypothetical protein
MHYFLKPLIRALRHLNDSELKPYPAEYMETWRVGDGAKNPRNDTEELIKPLRQFPALIFVAHATSIFLFFSARSNAPFANST